MNLIIELILKIFQAIFEEDTARRQVPKGRQRPEGPPRPPPRQGEHGEQDPQSVLAEFFRELQGLENPPPAPQQRPATTPPRQQGHPPPVPAYNQEETMVEHLRQQEAHIAALQARAAQMSRQIKEHLGVDEFEITDSSGPGKLKRLPGNTPLEQMIFAGVILGPCKAKQPRGRLL